MRKEYTQPRCGYYEIALMETVAKSGFTVQNNLGLTWGGEDDPTGGW